MYLLCWWHINKNILANCKKYFQTNDEWTKFMQLWNIAVSSLTGIGFEGNIRSLCTYYSNVPAVFNCVNQNWIPYKFLFVSCFVNNYPHFGSTCTSRVEGNHHTLKTYIYIYIYICLVKLNAIIFIA